MSMETKCALVRRIGEEEFFRPISIPPGAHGEIKFLGRGSRIDIFSNSDRSSVIIVDPKKRIHAFKYEDRNCTTPGERVNTDSEIEVLNEQMLALVFVKRRGIQRGLWSIRGEKATTTRI
jgi:hypothetical protein